MTSQRVRRVGVPLAVALGVLVLVLGVVRLVDPPGGGPGGSVSGVPGSGGDGQPGSVGSAEPQPPAPTADGSADPDAPMSRFTSVTRGQDDRSLAVRFWGGVDTCYLYAVYADETGAKVSLTLREKATFDGPCIELAQQYDRTVRLEEDLGVREVVDAVTGEVLLAPSP